MTYGETDYIECGQRCGVAMNQRDIARADLARKRFRKMQDLETGFDKAASQALFQKAYRAARKV